MKAIGYVRVSRVGSREGDSFLSPQLQRQSIERVCAGEGLELLDVVEELDRSGGARSGALVLPAAEGHGLLKEPRWASNQGTDAGTVMAAGLTSYPVALMRESAIASPL